MTRGKCQYCCLLTDNVEKHEKENCAEARKKYVCNLDMDGRVCGQRFTNTRGLSLHQAAKHTAEERGTTHNCNLCSFGTFNQKSLDEHLRRHREGRLRSRSRSRGPSVPRFVDQAEESANRRSRSNSRPLARDARSPNCSNTRPTEPFSRSSSRSRSYPTNQTANSRSRTNSPTDARARSRTRRSGPNSANKQSRSPPLNTSHEMPCKPIKKPFTATLPGNFDAMGMYNLNLMDADQAEAIIEGCNQQLLHMVEEIKRSYEEALEMCNRHGIPMSKSIRERIDKTMKVVLSPTGEVSDEEKGGEENDEGMEMNGY